jgi:Tol biopolymer transport system component
VGCGCCNNGNCRGSDSLDPEAGAPPEAKQIMRFTYELPEGRQFNQSSAGIANLAVSPDGSHFVYSTKEGLYLRSMDAWDAKRIAGTDEGSVQPFFSPDGQWIGYFSQPDRKLKKVAITGGEPQVMCDVGNLVGASWDLEDSIVYSDMSPGGGVMRVSPSGGTREPLISIADPDLAKGIAICPQMLPDGKTLLFTSRIGDNVQIAVYSLQSGKQRELFPGDTARYLRTGYIIYATNNLLAVPFDLKTLKVTGGSVPVIENVMRATYAPQYAISDSGTLAYLALGDEYAKRSFLWLDRNGREEPLAATPDFYGSPRISPDGKQIATLRWESVYIWDIMRKTMSRLTSDPTYNPIWTTDSKRVVFFTSGKENPGVCLRSANGTGTDELLLSSGSRIAEWIFPGDWSADGKSLLIQQIFPYITPAKFCIGSLSMEDGHQRKPLLNAKYRYDQPRISPGGRWITYTSDESGKNEIYVRPYPDVDGGRYTISNSGGDSPLWSPNGQELFYRNGDEIVAVPVTSGPAFGFGRPKILFRGSYVPANHIVDNLELSPWDISPDGKLFLMMKEVGSTASSAGGPRKINIVLNWTDELKQKVPVK